MRQLSLSRAFGLAGTVGVITGAISTFNIVVSTFQVGLNSFWSSVLTYWREFFHDTLLATVLKFLPFHVPAWLHEPIILWMIFAGLSVRTIAQARKLTRRNASRSTLGGVESWLFNQPAWLFYVIVIVPCFFLLPLVLARLVFAKPLRVRFFGSLEFGVEFQSADRTETYSYRNIVIAQAVLLLLVFAVMFFTNAGLP